MTDQFEQIRELLRLDAVASVHARDYTDPTYVRLARAVEAKLAGGLVGPADLAVLLRHFLVREGLQQQAGTATVLIPRSPFWPTEHFYERAGLTISRTATHFTLRALAWHPAWLPDAESYEPGAAASAERARRNYETVEGDPFLTALNLSNYLSVAQREAVRAVLSMPLGATLIVNLPTGSGKSMCAQLPPVLQGPRGSLTVVVVPTTALAMDQERALSALVGHPTAYFSEDSGSGERRRSILNRIRDGTQQVLFTSPEALLGILRDAVVSVARDGGLSYLVVDEAHIIEQWGDGFRSGFQELSGLRTELMRDSPADKGFRTVLLTATLSSECLATLTTLFKPCSTAFEVLSAVQLRPEPEYWVAQAASSGEQNRWVLEAVDRLPRSLILYVTRPNQAEDWLVKLRNAGYRRCEVVHGGTPSSQRERVIRQWQAHDTDLIVATSAFGLGMDQADVRSVIHATVPENVDRYYQEVGRGGRDGRASVALIVYTIGDLIAAKHMNRTTIISAARGRQRWRQMFGSPKRVTLGNALYRVPVDTVPSFGKMDIGMLNDRNMQWNVRTLTLMQRAGLIELEGEAQPSLPQGATNGLLAETNAPRSRVVRITDDRHLLEEAWMKSVEPERLRSARRDVRAFHLMHEVLDKARCFADIFADAYTIGAAAREVGLRTISVGKSCGGCPLCRSRRRPLIAGALPIPLPVWSSTGPLGPSLTRLLRGKSAAVFFDPNTESQAIKVLWWLASQGMRHVVISDRAIPEALHALTPTKTLQVAPFVTRLSEYQPRTSPRIPTAFFVDSVTVPSEILPNSAGQIPILRVLMLPMASRADDRPDRLLREVLGITCYSLAEFEGHLAL